MKIKMMIWTMILLLLVSMGSALAGTENADYTYYGLSAGGSSTAVYNTFIGNYAGAGNTTGDRNTFLGTDAGYQNSSGTRNTFLGYLAGYSNTTGSSNTYVGTFAGQDASTGNGNTSVGYGAGSYNAANNNTFLGYFAGYNNTTGAGNTYVGYTAGWLGTTGSNNTFLGYQTGWVNTTGERNTFLGYQAGYSNTTALGNNFIGYAAGHNNTTGSYNVFQGNSAGYANTTGVYNSFFGTLAGRNNTTGNYNTFIGFSAGYSNASGYGNVFIGYNAGYNETGSNKLYIANSSTATPLIYGNFATSIVNINGKLGIGTNSPSYPIQTAGGAYVTVGGVWTNASSRELKNNIQRLKIEDAVKTLQGLNPVTFTYKTSPEESHVGFIAEDVPELVATKDRKGLSSMDVVSVLTKVVQEQQAHIQKQDEITREQQKMIATLVAEINDLKRKVR